VGPPPHSLKKRRTRGPMRVRLETHRAGGGRRGRRRGTVGSMPHRGCGRMSAQPRSATAETIASGVTSGSAAARPRVISPAPTAMPGGAHEPTLATSAIPPITAMVIASAPAASVSGRRAQGRCRRRGRSRPRSRRRSTRQVGGAHSVSVQIARTPDRAFSRVVSAVTTAAVPMPNGGGSAYRCYRCKALPRPGHGAVGQADEHWPCREVRRRVQPNS
jgi:hypothetical protein